MTKRKPGRKSAAEQSVAPLAAVKDSKQPDTQHELKGRALAVYRAAISSFPSGHFSAGELPQLAAYARHVARGEDMERRIDDFDGDDMAELDRLTRMAERESRVSLALARTLRLTQQTRRQPISAGRAVQSAGEAIDFGAHKRK